MASKSSALALLLLLAALAAPAFARDTHFDNDMLPGEFKWLGGSVQLASAFDACHVACERECLRELWF